MELIKAGIVLLAVGIAIVAAAATIKGLGVLGKIGVGAGQVVVLMGLLIALYGGIRAMF